MRKKLILTHFIGVPISANDSLLNLLEKCKKYQIRDDAILPQGALHITLDILYLPSKEKIDLVQSILESIDFKSFNLEFKALCVLKGTSTNAKVLVTKPVKNEELNNLYKVISEKLNQFPELLLDRKEEKIFHVTLVNTKYTKDFTYSFSAKEILEEFKFHNFGTFNIQNISLYKSGLLKEGIYKKVYIKSLK